MPSIRYTDADCCVSVWETERHQVRTSPYTEYLDDGHWVTGLRSWYSKAQPVGVSTLRSIHASKAVSTWDRRSSRYWVIHLIVEMYEAIL